MDRYGTALLGDGNPTHMMQNILQEEEGEVYKHIKAFTGGFHMILETHRKRGSLFGQSHLEDVFSCWRTTLGQLNWVMNPGDPNQIDCELAMYVLAVYISGMRGLIETKKIEYEEAVRGIPDSPPPEIKICAADVVDFIVKRAKEYPIVMVILLEVRYAEVIFMLHKAEQDANADLYVTALKFLIPLFASTHATKYTNMVARFLVDWYCMPDAEKTIFTKGVFTRKTKNGRNIWSDKFVEWMMRDLRMWCSHVATPHTASILERTALNLNRKKKAKEFGRKERKATGEQEEEDGMELDEEEIKEFQIDHVLCEVLIFFDEANIFGPGNIQHIVKGPAAKFRDADRTKGVEVAAKDVNGFAQICDPKVKLNTQLPKARHIGQTRVAEYYETYYKTGDLNDPSRSEKDVSLTAINPLMSEEEKKLRTELIRCISMDTQVIDDLYVVSDLHKEIDTLNDQLNGNPEHRILKDGKEKKLDLCAIVRRLRMKMLDLNSDWATTREASAKEELEQNLEQSSENLMNFISDELEDPFYTLQCPMKERDQQQLFTLPFSHDDDDDDDAGGATALEPAITTVQNNRQSYGLSLNTWL